jgi:hypothetical protein
MVLMDSNGQEKYNHEDKAALLWDAFEGRLAISEFTQMHFNLSLLIQPMSNRDNLTLPTT